MLNKALESCDSCESCTTTDDIKTYLKQQEIKDNNWYLDHLIFHRSTFPAIK